jgi:hypothetical protein
MYRPVEKLEAPQNDELASQSQAICTQGEECDGVQLLLTGDECVRQVSNALVSRDPECRRCASSLSCAGVLAVVHGEQRLSKLCGSCGPAVDDSAVKSVGSFMLIPGFVATPSPPPEEPSEGAAPEADQANDPAVPAGQRPEPATPTPAPAAPAPKPSATPSAPALSASARADTSTSTAIRSMP